jgi:hypothetical protein
MASNIRGPCHSYTTTTSSSSSNNNNNNNINNKDMHAGRRWKHHQHKNVQAWFVISLVSKPLAALSPHAQSLRMSSLTLPWNR